MMGYLVSSYKNSEKNKNLNLSSHLLSQALADRIDARFALTRAFMYDTIVQHGEDGLRGIMLTAGKSSTCTGCQCLVGEGTYQLICC